MTKEVSELLKKLDIRAVETQLALRCAPLIAGLKPSNLLIINTCQAQALYKLLQDTKFSVYELYRIGMESVLLLYADKPLLFCLEQPEVRTMLWQKGYRDFSLRALLDGFAARYRSCRRSGEEFPHEMGLFLGYPPEDVRGFLENGGKHALYTGYWKVYQNPAQKIRLFKSYDQAKTCLIRFIANGAGMAEVLDFYGGQ